MAKSKSGSLLVWGAVAVLTFGMVGFGATGLSGRIQSIGTVGDLPLPVTEYASELNNQIASTSATFGQQISFAQAEAFGITTNALQRVISDRVLDNEMLQLGVSVGDEQVREEVLGTLAFAGPDGTFSRENYRAILRDNGLTEAAFEASIRDDSTRALLQVAILAGMPEPTVYAETLATFIGERRDFTWATLSGDDLDAPLPEPSDADLQAQYEATPDAYTSPETRVVTFAWLTPAMIQDEVTVDEAELREDYEARISEFVQPERRLVERLAFSTTEAAAEALARIESGEVSFDALVAERGLELADIDLGDVSEAEMGDAGAAIFAAEPGDVTGPADSAVGPALFRMNAILNAQEITFEEAVPELREERAAARARRVIEDQIDPITDLLAGGARLEDLAEQTDMELGQMDWTANSEDGIAAYAAFRAAVEGLEPGTYPELLELEDGGLFAVRVDEIVAPALQPFADVRAQVIADWETAETRRRVIAMAEGIMAQIEPDTEVTELGLSDAIAETGMTRRDFINETPPGFMERVFRLEAGEVALVEDTDKVIIVRLDGIAPPPEDDDMVEAETAVVAERAGQGIARDVFTYFSQALQAQTEITLNDAAINAVHANFR